jgi:hypothetical protein
MRVTIIATVQTSYLGRLTMQCGLRSHDACGYASPVPERLRYFKLPNRAALQHGVDYSKLRSQANGPSSDALTNHTHVQTSRSGRFVGMVWIAVRTFTIRTASTEGFLLSYVLLQLFGAVSSS